MSEESITRQQARKIGNGLDPRAWAVWLLAGAILTMLTRNPLYLLLLLAISRTVDTLCGNREGIGWSLPFWRVSAVIVLFSVLFNMLMAHIGSTVLFTLPESWWLIGGPITLEAAAFGFVSGLSLITLLSFFLAFSHAVPPHRMIQLVPRALHEMGLVALIAMTFLPEMLQQQRRIREAQAIRGNQIKGLRGWRPIIIPLIIGGFERSLNLAEAMVSRGFGATETQVHRMVHDCCYCWRWPWRWLVRCGWPGVASRAGSLWLPVLPFSFWLTD
ncbi:MAG: energy-coupling factor transporter transmembrane component T [Chloroflexota bacterium]